MEVVASRFTEQRGKSSRRKGPHAASSVDARTHAQATAPQIFSSGAPLQPFPSLNIS
jgi:hypothetical protein